MNILFRPKAIFLFPFVICIIFSSLLFSCTTERISYFKDIADTTKTKYVDLPLFTPPVIRPDDILNVSIQTLDEKANQLLNQGNLPILSGITTTNSVNAQQQVVSGYLVNREGDIHMAYIGTVHVGGMTTSAVRDSVAARISYYFKDPVVNVRFANFKVTVLGEVKTPATFSIPNEKPTVLDALGFAGDLTIFGKHNNVLLIRDTVGRKEITRLNLDSSNVIESKYFYLRPNDVLYVEPTESRVESTNAYRTRDIAVLAAGLSLLTVIAAPLDPINWGYSFFIKHLSTTLYNARKS